MGMLTGLLAGVGLFLIWWSTWVPEEAAAGLVRRETVWDRLRDELTQAGFEQTGPGALVAGSIMAAGLAGIVISRSAGSVRCSA